MNTNRLLHPDDERLLDYYLGQCGPPEARAVETRLADDRAFARRAEKLRALLGVLDACPADEPSEALLQRTVAAAESAARTEALLAREAATTRPVRQATFTLKELGALAAILLVAAAILLPSLQRARQLAADQACQANVASIGVALGQYANANDGLLPGLHEVDAAWLADGQHRAVSNSQNLWRLVRQGYAEVDVFQCPAGGCVAVERDVVQMDTMWDFPGRQYIGYSYRNAVNAEPLRITGEEVADGVSSALAILADRTPVFVEGKFDPRRLSRGNSLNHDERGQVVLYLDLHAAWTDHPAVGVAGDNIWLVRGVAHYTGTERPADLTDTFLLPSYLEADR